MFKWVFLIIGLQLSLFANGFNLKAGESLVFGFKAKNGKVITVALGKNDNYLVYRYGRVGKVELEYPKNKSHSFSKFIYSKYLRGGGAVNEGLDLQYLRFSNSGILYIIFDEYSAKDESRDVGIKIVRKKDNKTLATIHGIVKSIKGSLGILDDYSVKKDNKTEL